ncbi:MAG: serine acetyltransferase [Clostridia bacterium]|nr:serine acetyltransferase [Clostridia bacterium]MBR4458510.1 serine acetyltransferase [Clostridia bacterium]
MTETNHSAIDAILNDYARGRLIDRLQLPHRPDKASVYALLDQLFTVLYFGYYPDARRLADDPTDALHMAVEEAMLRTRQLVVSALPCDARNTASCQEDLLRKAEEITQAFFLRIPAIRQMLDMDLQALFDGDPAASSRDEILLAYPGFYAITIYRLAHELFLAGVPMLPRIMSERAHSVTGIDIHPGATIGRYFFIDHGTGIVIGETTVIGDHVKLYQGVTLGALSTRGGQALRGKKRHPTIGNRVTIYACASVLGDTVIGDCSTIGSNVFITKDIPANAVVTMQEQELSVRLRDTDGGK